MRPETVLWLALPSGTFRVWVEGHSGACAIGNSLVEALGLLAINFQTRLGITVREHGSCPLN